MKKGLLMHKRINITLPEDTVRLLDRVSQKGDRSGLIDRAIKTYVDRLGKASLRRQLREGYRRRGEDEVYLVSFDPSVGAEIKKTRPALVIQNNIGNRYSPIIIVAAITSKFDQKLYPTEVLVVPPEGGLEAPSVVALNQIRSIDRQRLVARLGALKRETMERVDRALKISVGLLEI